MYMYMYIDEVKIRMHICKRDQTDKHGDVEGGESGGGGLGGEITPHHGDSVTSYA